MHPSFPSRFKTMWYHDLLVEVFCSWKLQSSFINFFSSQSWTEPVLRGTAAITAKPLSNHTILWLRNFSCNAVFLRKIGPNWDRMKLTKTDFHANFCQKSKVFLYVTMGYQFIDEFNHVKDTLNALIWWFVFKSKWKIYMTA